MTTCADLIAYTGPTDAHANYLSWLTLTVDGGRITLPYSIFQLSSFDVGLEHAIIEFYKDYGAHDGSGYLGSQYTDGAPHVWDNILCLVGNGVNLNYPVYSIWNWTFGTFDDIYISKTFGDDSSAGCSWDTALKSVYKGYALLNSGGTLHVATEDYSLQPGFEYTKHWFLSPEDPLYIGLKKVILPPTANGLISFAHPNYDNTFQ